MSEVPATVEPGGSVTIVVRRQSNRMENHFDKDNPLHEHRGDRSASSVPESRPTNAHLYERALAAIRGRTEDPAENNCESRLLIRCSDSKARDAAIGQ